MSFKFSPKGFPLNVFSGCQSLVAITSLLASIQEVQPGLEQLLNTKDFPKVVFMVNSYDSWEMSNSPFISCDPESHTAYCCFILQKQTNNNNNKNNPKALSYMAYRISSLSVMCSILTAYDTPQFLFIYFLYSFLVFVLFCFTFESFPASTSPFPCKFIEKSNKGQINSALGYLSLVAVVVLRSFQI